MKLRALIILIALLLAGCQQRINSPDSSVAGDLTVSAAVSLKEAFSEIGELYEAKTGQKVDFNFGASGALQKQIETGAPVDVFASAGEQQMDQLGEKGLIDAATRRDFTRNTLVLIVPADSRLKIKNLEDLYDPRVRKIAVGNPKTVPAGQYAQEVLPSSGVLDLITPKKIFAEDVRQVLDYVARGEVDAGIVYATDIAKTNDKVKVVENIPGNLHSPILYPIAIVKDSKQKTAAQAFLDIVISAEGQAVLQKYGFAGAGDK
jgi:molybdate transport system substrate-binding protein